MSLVLLLFITILSAGCRSSPLLPAARGPVWLSFTREAVPELRSERVNDLALGFDGSMWLATDSGLTFFHKFFWGELHDSLRYRLYSADSTEVTFGYKVNAIAAGEDGSLWIGTAGGGVKRFRSGASSDGWRTYAEPEIPFNAVTVIAADGYTYGEVWIGTAVLGLGRFIPSNTEPFAGTWVHYDANEVPELRSNQIRSAEFNVQNGSFWFGTNLAVASHTEGAGWKTLYLPTEYRSTVFSIAFDYSGAIWLGKQDGAASFQEPALFRHYTSATTGGRLPGGRVNAVLTDNYWTRWFGTNGGLARLKDTSWTTFSSGTVAGFPGDTITALAYDRRGNLWIGTSRGVAVYNEAGTAF